jgi:hypothetical protein
MLTGNSLDSKRQMQGVGGFVPIHGFSAEFSVQSRKYTHVIRLLGLGRLRAVLERTGFRFARMRAGFSCLSFH